MPRFMAVVPSRCARAFTLVELLVVIALLALLATVLVPASAHTRPDTQAIQCLNNLRQLANSWKMYADDNGSRIVSAYPSYGGFTATWCAGNAETGGGIGSYTYSGADPAGIQAGLLWPYARSLGLYHCPTDHRLATSTAPVQFQGKPILRSISMNAYMAGRSYGTSPTWVITNPSGAQDPKHPVYIKEISRKTIVVAHDENNECGVGDKVVIEETRPLSKIKRWRVVSVILKAPVIGE